MDAAAEPLVESPGTGVDAVPAWVPAALGSADVGLAVIARDGALLWGNRALATLAADPGVEPTHAWSTIADLVDPAERPTVEQALGKLHRGEPTGTIRARSRSGRVWLDLVLAPLPLDTAGHHAVLVHALDVTAEVQATRSLQVLSANTLDVVALIDDEGRITWVSPSAQAALGRDPGSLVGIALTALVAPEDLLGLSDALAGAEPGQEPIRRTVRFRSTTGAYRFMSVTARPVSDVGNGSRIAIAMRDATEELRAKRELARSEEQFRMAMLGAPEGMAVTDSQDRVVQANPALCELLGTTVAGLIGHRFREFIPPEDREQVDQWRDRLLSGATTIERCQHRLASATSEVWVDHSIGVMRDDLGNPQLFVHQFADRTAAHRLQADLAYRASHDVQTGLANKAHLRTRLGQRLGCPPESTEFVGVLFCDIDNLKPINDRFGHLIGDAVISAVANRLERAVRRQDVVARVGGDEFVIVLDHCSNVEELAVVARHVHAAAGHPVETPAGPVDTTITVGAVLAESTAGTDEALARADQALYRAKKRGRNRICVEGMGDC